MLPHKYNNIATISGHSSPISVVLFSFDGKYLASGSDDGTILINATRSWKVVKRLTNVSPVTALMWDPTLPMMLLCGFATGAVVTVHIGHGDQSSEQKVWSDAFDGPIHCITSDGPGRTFAIGHGSKVTLLNQRAIAHWEDIRILPDPPEFTCDLPPPSPRTLYFTEDKRLIVSYLDHGLAGWDPISLSLEWHIVPRSCSIGWSAVSPDEEHIVVSNLYDGLDFYSISGRSLSYSIPYPINQQKNRPVQIAFSGDGTLMVVGGTSGSVRLLDSRSCETTQILPHSGDLVQAVDFFGASGGAQIIAAGVSESTSDATIKIWALESPEKQKPPTPNSKPLKSAEASPRHLQKLSIFVGLLLVFCALAIANDVVLTLPWGLLPMSTDRYTFRSAPPNPLSNVHSPPHLHDGSEADV